MDFKGYSELFHAAINRRSNSTPRTRPTAPMNVATLPKKKSDDYHLVNKFWILYNNDLSEREKNASTPKRLWNIVMSLNRNMTNAATFKLDDDELRQELKDFVAKYGK